MQIIFGSYLQNNLTLIHLRLHSRKLSSAGSEHLPYKQRVTGSNPVASTNEKAILKSIAFFHLPKICTKRGFILKKIKVKSLLKF